MYKKFAKVIVGRGQEFAHQIAAELDSGNIEDVLAHALVGNDEIATIVIAKTPVDAEFDTTKWPETDVPKLEVTIVDGAAAVVEDPIACDLGTVTTSKVEVWDTEADQALTAEHVHVGDEYTVKVTLTAKKFLSTKMGVNGGFVDGTLSDDATQLVTFVENVVALPAAE